MNREEFFSDQRCPYYIVAPDYTEVSSGIRVLHYLCHALNMKGHEAYLTTAVVNPALRTPLLTEEIQQNHQKAGRQAIAIYPEIVHGNPLGLNKVVRYLLNKPGFIGGDTEYDENEFILQYREEFVPDDLKVDAALFLPHSDLSIFNRNGVDESQRSGCCFYRGRYQGDTDEVPADAVEISFKQKRSLRELAEIYKKTSLLYTYVPSAATLEAILCGCTVVYLPNEQMPEPPLTEDPRGMAGAAWGTDPAEIQRAKETLDQHVAYYGDVIDAFEADLESFIESSQRYGHDERQCSNAKPPSNEASAPASASSDDAQKAIDEAYRAWTKQHSPEVIEAQLFAERMILKWHVRPRVHVIVLLLPGQDEGLAATIDSVAAQLHKEWALTVVASIPSPAPVFDEAPNLAWVQVAADQSFLSAANQAMQNTDADWVALVPAGTTLEPHALISVGDYANRYSSWKMIYTDSDRINTGGERVQPQFRPDINLELLRSLPYIGVSCFFEREALLSIGGFAETGSACIHDACLKVVEQQGEAAVGHISDMLIHVPQGADSVDTADAKFVVSAHLQRSGVTADVVDGSLPGSCRVLYKHTSAPRVSIVIPTRDKLEYLQPCIESVMEKTLYADFEIIVVDNQSTDPDMLAYLQALPDKYPERVQVLSHAKDFNYGAIGNLGAAAAQGEYLLMLDNDTLVLQGEWLERMLDQAQRPDVGIVGVRLLNPGTGKVQHAGLVLGMGKSSIAGGLYNGAIELDDPGYMGRAQVDQELSAVSGSCLMLRKSVLTEIGGFSETDLQLLFQDVDLCLKVRSARYRVIWTPQVTLAHYEGITRKALTSQGLMKAAIAEETVAKDRDYMLQKWGRMLGDDPAFNRHLSLQDCDSQIENEVVINWDTRFHDRERILGMPVRGGSGEYRVAQPLIALSRAGMAQTDTTRSARSLETRRSLTVAELYRAAPDTLVFQNVLNNEGLDALEEARKHFDAFHVMQIDDLITNIPKKSSAHKPIYNAYRDIRPRIRRSLAACDRLVVTTEPLADYFSDMIDDIRVVPNYLHGDVWNGKKSQRREGSKPRVGWAGAQQHQGDLELIFEVVSATCKEVDWVFFGMCPDEIRPFVAETYAFERGFTNYIDRLASLDLDIALAPLEQHPFNEAKSNLRVLEYGFFGWSVICTDILPYQGLPATRLPNVASAWTEAVRERANDLEATRAEGLQLQNHVRSHWMLEGHLDTWFDVLTREGSTRRAPTG